MMEIKNILELAKDYLSPKKDGTGKDKFDAIMDGLAERGQEPDKQLLSQSRMNVLNRIHKIQRRKNRVGNWLSIGAKYAAGLFLVVFITWVIIDSQSGKPKESRIQIKETGEGMRSTIILSDGSRVRINENSKLEFPEVFTGEERVVKLSGEAYFNVRSERERPFKVLSENSIVTVLGTSFNIHTNLRTEITVTSGKVRVTDAKQKEEVVMVEGQQAIVTDEAIQVKTVNPGFFIGWHTKKLEFKDEPVEEVFSVLERAYGIHIEVRSRQSPGICLITGHYEGEKIETIFKGLTNLIDFDFEFDRKRKTITIDLKNCKQ